MASFFTFKSYQNKRDTWDADEKARDISNYTTPEQTFESLNHILNRYLKLKKFDISSPKNVFDAAIDDSMNTLYFDTEFHKFAKENYAFYITYDKTKQRLIFDKFLIN